MGALCVFKGVCPSTLALFSSRPERTRISYFALLATSTCAALRRESRMQMLNATGLHRKSGGVQWRDCGSAALARKCFSTERTRMWHTHDTSLASGTSADSLYLTIRKSTQQVICQSPNSPHSLPVKFV